MPTVGALEFQRKFGEFQHQAQREPVEITVTDAANMCCCPQIIMTGFARRPSAPTGRRMCPTWCWPPWNAPRWTPNTRISTSY